MKGVSRNIIKVLLAMGVLLVLADCGGGAATTHVSMSVGVGYGGFGHRRGYGPGWGYRPGYRPGRPFGRPPMRPPMRPTPRPMPRR